MLCVFHKLLVCNHFSLRSAGHWAAFARLEPFVTSIVTADYGTDPSGWPDQIKAFHRDMWVGEYDADLHRLSSQLPGHYDSRHAEMAKDRIQSGTHCVKGWALEVNATRALALLR